MEMDSEFKNKAGEKVSLFYLDETFLEIEGKKHIIVCALTPESPINTTLEMVKVKKEIGFNSLDEVKINTKGLTQELKIKLTDGIINLIRGCTAFISILEGENKQQAAEMITYQVYDYCNQNNIKGYCLYFDKDLVSKPGDFEQFVRNNLKNGAECFGIQHFNSTSEQLIQCCDIFLGLFRLSLQIEFGNRIITRKVYMPAYEEDEDWSLSNYVTLFTRGQIWGKVEIRKSYYEVEGKTEEVIHPYHCSFDLGVRLNSNISEESKEIIKKHLSTVYLGCLS